MLVSEDYTPYLEHELTHYHRQGVLPFIWLLKYIFIRDFRRQEELRAYIKEIRTRKSMGLDIKKHFYAHQLATGYCNIMTHEEALKILEAVC